tara:strand:- start:3353 stop:3517 length:165 start_codon:yes stop_codon:yes gene_type:complete
MKLKWVLIMLAASSFALSVGVSLVNESFGSGVLTLGVVWMVVSFVAASTLGLNK